MSAPEAKRSPVSSEVDRQIASLSLSQLEGTASLAVMRSVHWYNTLARLGLFVPLVVVHDLGGLIAGVGRPAPVVRGGGDPGLCEAWRRLLVNLADAELVKSHGGWKHRDAMIGVVLARVLGSLVPQLPEEVRVLRPVALPVDAHHYAQHDLHRHARAEVRAGLMADDQGMARAWLRTLTEHALLPILELEQIDIDALRLFGMFRGSSGDVAGLDLADLYNVMLGRAMADVVDFSMELLPSLLEAKRDAGQQSFSIDGYASIERHGSLDDLMLSELAYDEDLFEQKLINHDLFYYTHEKQIETTRRSHQILIDGSASMRGVREVFARGLALALGKRLSMLGEEVELRFFDSRIYEGVRVGGTQSAEVPYVLQFRAERGRNYAKVLRQLTGELAGARGGSGQVAVYLLTHGECQFPPGAVQQLTQRALVYGIYVLPRGPLTLPYLESLHRVHVIDALSLSHGRRAGAAREIISGVESDLEPRRGQMRPTARSEWGRAGTP